MHRKPNKISKYELVRSAATDKQNFKIKKQNAVDRKTITKSSNSYSRSNTVTENRVFIHKILLNNCRLNCKIIF